MEARSNMSVGSRAVGYQRVSRTQQGDRFGLVRQENAIRAFAEDGSWHYLRSFVDLGVSRLVQPSRRPAFSALMAAAGRREFDMVVIESIDRLGSGRGVWDAVEGLAGAGVPTAVSALRVDDLYRLGRPAVELLAAHAVAEVDDLRRRTQGGIQAKAQATGAPHIGGRPPFGYRVAREKHYASHLEIDLSEARTITEVVDLLLRDGMSFAAAAARLNAEGRPTRSGRPWTEGNLRSRVLSSAVIDAAIHFRGRHALRSPDGNPLWGASVTISLPRIVSEDDADALVVRFRRTSPARERSVYPLSGRMTSPCGETYTGADSSTLSWGYRGYRCRGRYRVDRSPCTCATLDADLVDNHVWRSVCKMLDGRRSDEPLPHVSRRAGLEWTIASLRDITRPELRRVALNQLDVTVTVVEDREARRGGAPCAAAAWHRARGIGVLPQDLSDEEWDSVAPLLPRGRGDRVRRSVDAIFAKARSGAAWPTLRDVYGSTSTPSHYFTVWTHDGTWENVCNVLAGALCADVATPRQLPIFTIAVGASEQGETEHVPQPNARATT